MQYLACLTLLVVSHVVGDGLWQSRKTAKNKSKDIRVLIKHLSLLSIPVFLVMLFIAKSPFHAYMFTLCNAIIHGIIDWNIWNGYKVIVLRRFLKHYNESEICLASTAPEYVQRRGAAFEADKEYADDPWFYHFIVADQALHVLTFIGLLSTGIFI